MRTTKKPDIRSAEFLDTAMRLFNKKGYENTSVDDIVRRMGVAKGLFYYYFDSKEEVLDMLLDSFMTDMEKVFSEAVDRPGLSALQRLRAMLEASAAIKMKARSLVLYIHKDRNRALHAALEKRGYAFMLPALGKLIGQGAAEGIFDTRLPHETALAFLGMIDAMGHENIEGLTARDVRRRFEAIIYLGERLLGARRGTLGFIREFLPRSLRIVEQRNRLDGKRKVR